MEPGRFDHLTCSVSGLLSRRAFAGVLGLSALALPGFTDARKKRKKRKKKWKPKLNSFGCVNVGGSCKSSGQCCSGICEGQQCRAHHGGACLAEQDSCVGAIINCSSEAVTTGACLRTTGGAPYCAGALPGCFQCAKDADCVGVCGEGAACVVCHRCVFLGTETACVGASEGSCGIGP
jgi:hypothetical protein